MSQEDDPLPPSPAASSENEPLNFDGPTTTAPENLYFARSPGSHNHAHTHNHKNTHSHQPNRSTSPIVITGIRSLGAFLITSKRKAALNTSSSLGTAWQDKDDSGTYDPRSEHSHSHTVSRRTTTNHSTNTRVRGSGGHAKGEGRVPRAARPEVGYVNVTTLVLNTEKGKKFLRDLASSPRESKDRQEVEVESESDEASGAYKTRKGNKRARVVTSVRDDGLTTDQLDEGHPQRRGCIACFNSGNDDCSLIDDGMQYPCEACEDAGIDCELIIPPIYKRACSYCKAKRLRCSYLLNAGKGVKNCEACTEAKVKCVAGPFRGGQPRIEEKEKEAIGWELRKYVACNECREAEKRCSLKRGEEGPCNRCSKEEIECTFEIKHDIPPASPITKFSGNKKHGKSSNRRTNSTHILPPSFWTTGRVENPRHRREINKKKEKDAYYELDLNSLINEVIGKHQQRFTKKQARIHSRAQLSSPSLSISSSSVSPPSLSSPFLNGITSTGHQTHTLLTAFCHPIIFNYIPDPMHLHPGCDWCGFVLFGLSGYGEREVTVIPYPTKNGMGYEELENGWGDEGFHQSRMCVDCTTYRIGIVGCELGDEEACKGGVSGKRGRNWGGGHRLREIEGIDPRTWDDASLWRSCAALKEGNLVGGEDGALAAKTKWCSICPRPAVVRCTSLDTPRSTLSNTHTTPPRSEIEREKEREKGKGMEREREEEEGCGLELCAECHDLWTKVWASAKKEKDMTTGKALGKFIKVAGGRDRRHTYPDGLRADVGFVREDGELIVRMKWEGSGEEKEFLAREGERDVNGFDEAMQLWGAGDGRNVGWMSGVMGIGERDKGAKQWKDNGRGKAIDLKKHIDGGEARQWKGKGNATEVDMAAWAREGESGILVLSDEDD